MSRGVNKVIIVGNLGNDPDVKYTQDGRAIANISVATTESWKDKSSGEQQSKTEWHRIVFFNRLAEIVSEYLKKGSQVYVEGKLQTRKWQDDLRKGFEECFRVLKPNGTLIFKWNETQIKVRDVLDCAPWPPLFGNVAGRKNGTHWIAFMKTDQP